MGVWNTVCPDNLIVERQDEATVESNLAVGSYRVRKRTGATREQFGLKYTDISRTDYSTLKAELVAAKFSGRTPFTPPGEGSDRAFTIVKGSWAEEWKKGYSVKLQLSLRASRNVLTN